MHFPQPTMHIRMYERRTVLAIKITLYVLQGIFIALRILELNIAAAYLIANPESPADYVKYLEQTLLYKVGNDFAILAVRLGIVLIVPIVYCTAEVVAIVLEKRVFIFVFTIIDWVACIARFVASFFLGPLLLLSLVLTLPFAIIMTVFAVLVYDKAWIGLDSWIERETDSTDS